MQLSEIHTIAVAGAGQMGAGIAQVCAAKGFSVLLSDVSEERAAAGRAAIDKQLQRLVVKGKLRVEERSETISRIATARAEESFERAELIIEAATENQQLKLALFRTADERAKPNAILASNTSSISISLLAGHTQRPGQVIGMHFMNPVPVMKLVEIVRGIQTSQETLGTVRELSLLLEKIAILSEDRPGFLVNRMLLPLLNEACFALQEGVGSAEDIDQGAKLGLNHPLGPLELADLIGLDTVLAIAEVLHRDLGDDKYRPAALLRNLVAAGWVGRKAKRGFYVYDDKGQKLRSSLFPARAQS